MNAVLSVSGAGIMTGRYGSGVDAVGLPGGEGRVAADRKRVAGDYPREPCPPLPNAACGPALDDLTRLRARAAAVPDADPEPAFLGDDWSTEGDWMGSYGRQYGVFWAGHAPLNDFVRSEMSFSCRAAIGPKHLEGDSVRHWIQWLTSASQRVLWNPVEGCRRQSDIDDHAEAYPLWDEGPGLWLVIRVPEGVHRVSLYFYNKDGHTGPNRWRDYTLRVKPYAVTREEAETLPTLARARVKDFWGGVYKQIIIPGPNKYYFWVSRNGSHNTVLAATFVDRVSHPEPGARSAPSPWLPGTPAASAEDGGHVGPDAGPAGRTPPVVREACALWRIIGDALCRDGGEVLERRGRVAAARAVVPSAGSVAAGPGPGWGRILGLWTPAERAAALKSAQRAFASVRRLDAAPLGRGVVAPRGSGP